MLVSVRIRRSLPPSLPFGQGQSLTHLNFNYDRNEVEGARKLAAVLGQCKSLAHLAICGNDIGDEGAKQLGSVLGQ